MFYGAAVWDPVLIVSQIVVFQCLFYLCLGAILLVLLLGSRMPMSMEALFNYQLLALSAPAGWRCIVAFLVNAGVCAWFLPVVVERAKKCADFAATAVLIHCVACSWHTGLPANVEWWSTNLVSVAIMAVLGELLCMRRELREIPIRLRAGSASSVYAADKAGERIGV